MNRYLKYTLLALLWGAVVAYIVVAAGMTRRGREERKVRTVEIEVVDSSSQGHLVSSRRVHEWIRQSGIRTIGTPVDKVDLTGLEQLIAKNGFVDRAVAYVTYSGRLCISISQRRPVVRLLVDGFNSYVTSEGYVFDAPRTSALYMPVVSGSYRPPVALGYEGEMRAYIDAEQRKIDERIKKLERDKYPLYVREIKNDQHIRDLRRMRIKRQWWKFEPAAVLDKRIEELRAKKLQLRRAYRYEARLIQEGIDRISERQAAELQLQKKLEKNYRDFMKLVTFVKFVEDDDFWRSEVVQIITRAAPSGALEVELVPRSGRHTILFGRLEEVERKFDKLLRFYRSGLNNIGWDTYRTIDIRYNDQVVCRK